MFVNVLNPNHIFSRSHLFIFRQRGRVGEWERNISVWLPLVGPLLGTWPATQACPLIGNWNGNPLVCRPVLNPLSQHQPGLNPNHFLSRNRFLVYSLIAVMSGCISFFPFFMAFTFSLSSYLSRLTSEIYTCFYWKLFASLYLSFFFILLLFWFWK